ncbi:F0F1 ATP synthase subunit epsilon [soil metagenome]
MPLHLSIVTPEKTTFSDTVETVVIPGLLGELGILPQHTPLLTGLKPGELRYTKDGKSHELAVGEGLVEVMPDKVSVLTDLAVGSEEIDEAAVQKALDRAEAALKEISGDEEVAAVQAAIQKSLAQLHLKRKRRTL